jgi:4-azaleucine resistance transporter AzlC
MRQKAGRKMESDRLKVKVKGRKSGLSIWKEALIDTLPIMAGYILLGTGFGVMLAKAGYHVGWAVLMSVTMFAGSMQYVAVTLLASQVSIFNAVMMTLLVNARHVFYGISLLERYEKTGRAKPYLIFGLTDETYSLVCRRPYDENEDRTGYYFAVTLLNHSYWIAGGAIGNLLGSMIKFDSRGIDFAMTALFVVIFVEQWQQSKDHMPALIGLIASTVSLIFVGSRYFLLAAMPVILALLLLRKHQIENKTAPASAETKERKSP